MSTNSTSPSPRRWRPVAAGALGLALVLGGSACSDDETHAGATSKAGDPATTVERPGKETNPISGGTSSAPEDRSDEPQAHVSAPDGVEELCAPGKGKTVTELPDVVVEPVEVEAFTTEAEIVGGREIPGVDIPAFTIPGVTVEGGCIVEHDAPAGCLGAVEISGIEIPGFEIPGASVPAVLDVAGVTEPAVEVEGVSVPGVRVEQVCQESVSPDDTYQPGVYRPPAYRGPAYRGPGYRGPLYRPAACEADECVASVTVPSVSVPSVSVDSASADSALLEGRQLPGREDVPVYGDDDETAYLAPADVLFDVDSDELRPEADAVLQAIAGQVMEAGPEAAVSVEGHTDSDGSDAYNQDLSERRAQAVADWLTSRGGLDPARITVVGRGETAPVADNGSDEGRQQNRRVVIGVTFG